MEIVCDFTAASETSESSIVDCSISAGDPLQQLSADTVLWEGDRRGDGAYETLELQQNLSLAADGSWRTKVRLDERMRQSMSAIRLTAGDVVGEWNERADIYSLIGWLSD